MKITIQIREFWPLSTSISMTGQTGKGSWGHRTYVRIRAARLILFLVLCFRVYEEVGTVLRHWKDLGIKLYITLGSAEFLKTVLSKTTQGDLLPVSRIPFWFPIQCDLLNLVYSADRCPLEPHVLWWKESSKKSSKTSRNVGATCQFDCVPDKTSSWSVFYSFSMFGFE